MKRILFMVLGLAAAGTMRAQGGFATQADTVYLQYGNMAAVHVKKIEASPAGTASAYQIKTHESLDLSAMSTWSNIEGGYQWTAEQFKDGFRSLEVQKIVFADGFVLPFEGGDMDRSLLLKAPRYKANHGDFMAEGVIPLTREETRTLIGDEAYYLSYQVRKNQARAGLAKFILGTTTGFVCYLKRDWAIDMTRIPTLIGGREEYIGSASWKYNPTWQTATGSAAATAVYGVAEMALANLSIRHLASSFRTYQAPSRGTFRLQAIAGGGLILAGGALAYWGYDRMAKDSGWSETYALQTTAGVELPVKIDEDGHKMAVPWLIPAAGALLVNFGLTELVNGLSGLGGYGKVRSGGARAASLQVTPVPYGVGISMVF